MLTFEEMVRLKREWNITNSQLSQESGVPIGTVNKVISGETKNPRRRTVEELERALLRLTTGGAGQHAALLLRESSPLCPRPAHDESGLTRWQKEVLSDPRQRRLMGLSEVALSGGKRQGEYTVDDYLRLSVDRRLELIDGVLYDMASPKLIHQRVVQSLFRQTDAYILKKGGPCEVILSPMDVHFPEDDRTVVQPDLLIVCDPDKLKEWVMGAPDFVLEVVSGSSVRRDCVIKAKKYQETGVREYWIIDPEEDLVIAYDFEKRSPVRMCPLKGQLGLLIYEEDLIIDLDEVARAAWRSHA